MAEPTSVQVPQNDHRSHASDEDFRTAIEEPVPPPPHLLEQVWKTLTGGGGDESPKLSETEHSREQNDASSVEKQVHPKGNSPAKSGAGATSNSKPAVIPILKEDDFDSIPQIIMIREGEDSDSDSISTASTFADPTQPKNTQSSQRASPSQSSPTNKIVEFRTKSHKPSLVDRMQQKTLQGKTALSAPQHLTLSDSSLENSQESSNKPHPSLTAKSWWMVDLECDDAQTAGGATRLVQRAMLRYCWPEAYTRRVLQGYKQFLLLIADTENDLTANDLIPCVDVDKLWHEHSMDVQHYKKDLQIITSDTPQANIQGILSVNLTSELENAQQIQAKEERTRALLHDKHGNKYDQELWCNKAQPETDDVRSSTMGPGQLLCAVPSVPKTRSAVSSSHHHNSTGGERLTVTHIPVDDGIAPAPPGKCERLLFCGVWKKKKNSAQQTRR